MRRIFALWLLVSGCAFGSRATATTPRIANECRTSRGAVIADLAWAGVLDLVGAAALASYAAHPTHSEGGFGDDAAGGFSLAVSTPWLASGIFGLVSRSGCVDRDDLDPVERTRRERALLASMPPPPPTPDDDARAIAAARRASLDRLVADTTAAATRGDCKLVRDLLARLEARAPERAAQARLVPSIAACVVPAT